MASSSSHGLASPRAAAADPRHHPDLFRQVVFLVAAHGHIHEAAAAIAAAPDLRHDVELLALTQLAATTGGVTRLLRAVQRDDLGRVAELLAASLTAESRAALASAPDAAGRAPLMAARSAWAAQALLDAGAEALAEDDEGNDALHHAVASDSDGTLAALLDVLELGAGSALLCEARSGAVARRLLDAGADALAEDDEGNDALDHAVVSNRADVLAMLLAALPGDSPVVPSAAGDGDDDVTTRRARVGAVGDDGRTLLMNAVHSVELVRLLLDAGADALMVDVDGHDALDLAESSCVLALLASLTSDEARRTRVNEEDEHGLTFFVKADHATRLQLLTMGADPRATDEDGRDAFDEAVASNDVSTMAALLAALPSDGERVARLNAVADDDDAYNIYDDNDDDDDDDDINIKHTLLVSAFQCIAMMQLLLAAGASVLAVDRKGRDALYVAVARDRADVLAVLLVELPEHDEKLNHVYEFYGEIVYRSSTMLSNARSSAVARLLLDAGADPLVVHDEDGHDAFASAVKYDCADVLAVLLAALPGDSPAELSSGSGSEDHELVTRRDRVLAAGVDGCTLLMDAVGSAELVRLLLAAGVDPLAVDSHGSDALDEAVTSNRADVLALLLAALPGDSPVEQSAGSDGFEDGDLVTRRDRVNVIGGYGHTLLCRGAAFGSIELVRLLLDAGADPLTVDSRGSDAFVACTRTDVLAMLLAALPSDEARRARTSQLDAQRAVTAAAAAAAASSSAGTRRGSKKGLPQPPQPNSAAAKLAASLAALGSDAARRECVNRRGPGGSTQLMAASNPDLVAVLLRAGADPTAVDAGGRDALEHAAERLQALVVTALLEALGADATRQRVLREGGPHGSLAAQLRDATLSARMAAVVRRFAGL